MPRFTIVVESRRDAALLRRLLPKPLLAELRFFAAQGQLSLSSLARNILVQEGEPLLVVMDADTHNPDAAEESRQFAKAAISHVAGHLPVDVFAFVPEIEVVFFEAPSFWTGVLGRPLEPAEIFQGVTAPKRTMTELLERAGLQLTVDALVSRADEQSVNRLRDGKQWRCLVDVLNRLLTEVARLNRREPLLAS